MSNHPSDPGHGDSPAAWTAIIVMLLGFALGTVAFFLHQAWLVWILSLIHICVEGMLRADQNPVDALRATFPAGTLSGAPKPRALQIIDELEPVQRGVYGGVVGYFGLAGAADLAIAIRTATIKNGVAMVQAGAGIVADSVPESEDAECRSKAAAPLRAIAIGNTLHALGGAEKERAHA